MYRLFAAPNSYAMVAHSVLEELGVAYELAWVEIFTDKPDPAFRSMSTAPSTRRARLHFISPSVIPRPA
jgi:hypothetical protein